ncbi:MAG TPA: hypothetical protein VMT24_11620 [Aggregatilineaceae bacterium]|nr:hypothetical protein [Aggregatilineaceae bacterium]
MSEMKPQPLNVQKQTQEVLNRLGIDVDLAIKVLISAVVFGLVAALVDRIFALPSDALLFMFGYIVAVINGPTYSVLKGKDDLAGVIMAAVDGFIALLAWWLLRKVLGDQSEGVFKVNPADQWNFWKVLLDGVILGLVGFGWFALLRRLPAKLLP